MRKGTDWEVTQAEVCLKALAQKGDECTIEDLETVSKSYTILEVWVENMCICAEYQCIDGNNGRHKGVAPEDLGKPDPHAEKPPTEQWVQNCTDGILPGQLVKRLELMIPDLDEEIRLRNKYVRTLAPVLRVERMKGKIQEVLDRRILPMFQEFYDKRTVATSPSVDKMLASIAGLGVNLDQVFSYRSIDEAIADSEELVACYRAEKANQWTR
jgi:hypothetical protein